MHGFDLPDYFLSIRSGPQLRVNRWSDRRRRHGLVLSLIMITFIAALFARETRDESLQRRARSNAAFADLVLLRF